MTGNAASCRENATPRGSRTTWTARDRSAGVHTGIARERETRADDVSRCQGEGRVLFMTARGVLPG